MLWLNYIIKLLFALYNPPYSHDLIHLKIYLSISASMGHLIIFMGCLTRIHFIDREFIHKMSFISSACSVIKNQKKQFCEVYNKSHLIFS